MQAYKGYVKTLLTRKNSINGLTWSEDPAIFALELANEPATTSNYEVNAGIKPGSIVNTWAQEMATYIRSLDPNHMVRACMHPACFLAPHARRAMICYCEKNCSYETKRH